MIDLTKYELKPIYKNNVLDHYGLVPKVQDPINAGQPDENTRLTLEPDRTLEQIAKETCEGELTCQID